MIGGHNTLLLTLGTASIFALYRRQQ